MTDKKLTDNEIIKALECCIEGDCDNCHYDEQTACNEYMKQDALDLINRLQAENERLKEFATSKCADCAGCTSWKCDCANIEAQSKAEAYKEFAYELMQIPDVKIYKHEIKNLLKEKVGDNNES